MKLHAQPRPFVYALKQALNRPELWLLRGLKVRRAGLDLAATTQHEWTANINGVEVLLLWLRYGDGYGMEDGKELELGLDHQSIQLEPYEFEKLFDACEGLQRHLTTRVTKERAAKLVSAMRKLEDTLSKPSTGESTLT
jgi:hypothetical protein